MLPFAVGIAGGTGSGKTTIARLLAESLGPIALLDMDSYYLDRSGVPAGERGAINFDEPDALDVQLLLQHLRLLRAGRPVAKPTYSFESHTRIGAERVVPAPIVLVEGLLALWWAPLRDSLDVKVYLDAPADLRLSRRLERDVRSRGRSREAVLRQYEATVRPMHARYVEPTRAHADLVLQTDKDPAHCLSLLRDVLGRRPDLGSPPCDALPSRARPRS